MALHMPVPCPALTALNLAQPQLRDLAWACLGPPLLHLETLQPGNGVTDARLPLTAARAAWLQELDRQPQPLIDWLTAQQATRLGLYFERLWYFFLTHDSETELLAHNLPVRSGGQTLGEFDCLYYCRAREQPVHLELAVKFYLGWRRTTTGAEQSSAAEWLGPNPVDRLDLKLQRLLQHQSRLSLDPVGSALLASRGLAQPLREIALRGSLFQPAHDRLSPPAGYNPALPLPHWYTLTDWRAQAGAEERFLVLPRLRWLSPLLHSADTLSPEALFTQLQERFTRGGRPALVVQVNDQGDESRRFFLAGNDWPRG
ncbi:MAG: DUF1853 family protein [Haliea sp.]|uniref:DUF1853 family protein n=1 Tax=Haliea sp. TaxID=1932666 RepID=UPI0032EEF6EA